MKYIFSASLFCMLSFSAFAQSYNLVATCTAPALGKEKLSVYLSSNFKKARVISTESGVSIEYFTKVVTSGGPVLTIDFSTERTTDRIFIATDGGHELHYYNDETRRFVKKTDLICKSR